MLMTTGRNLWLPALLMAVGACSQSSGEISRDAEKFEGIAAAATITASGTEPFWTLAIAPQDEGYSALYSTPENLEGTRFPATRFAGNNGASYAGELDGAQVLVALTPGECSDSMSDRTYPYSATLALGDEVLFGCAYTSDEPFTGEVSP